MSMDHLIWTFQNDYYHKIFAKKNISVKFVDTYIQDLWYSKFNELFQNLIIKIINK